MQIFLMLLSKQYGVTPKGWRAVVGGSDQPGMATISVVDIVDACSLVQVRSHKKQMNIGSEGKAETGRFHITCP